VLAGARSSAARSPLGEERLRGAHSIVSVGPDPEDRSDPALGFHHHRRVPRERTGSKGPALSAIAGEPVANILDIQAGFHGLDVPDVLIFALDCARVVVRASGREHATTWERSRGERKKWSLLPARELCAWPTFGSECGVSI
jgi:hypothetical protein